MKVFFAGLKHETSSNTVSKTFSMLNALPGFR